jgi:hypothetical protein
MAMTRSEAKRLVREAFPGRSVCLTVTDWYHAGTEKPDAMCYCVQVLPGWDDSKCSTVTGQTLAGAVEKALEMRPPHQLPTAEEADRHFAEADAAAELVPSI